MRVEFCGERPEEGGAFLRGFYRQMSSDQLSTLIGFLPKMLAKKRRCRPQIKLLKFETSSKKFNSLHQLKVWFYSDCKLIRTS